MAKKVVVIPAVSRRQHTIISPKVKTCAYVRVSTNKKAQKESYATQVEHYTELIENNPLWEFAGIFADEAVTGTKTQNRTEFKKMIQECEDGNIDLIITKSIARFARNTVDCIQTIRKLKALGIGILFEKENINTLTEKNELLITILSSIAQGESEDFSGNNRWGIKKRFQDGSFIISTPAYGYEKDENGNLIIQEEEAEVIKSIFQSYLNGMGCYMIAKKLNEKKIPTIRNGKEWYDKTIKEILENPIYEGDLLLQKTYTQQIFPYSKKENKGQEKKYQITDNHPPIITREEGGAVREIMNYRVNTLHMDGKQATNRYLFTSRIMCSCGSYLRRQKIYAGKTKERIIWTCPKHVQDKEFCKMKAMGEEQIHQAFIQMWNKLYTNQGQVLEPLLHSLIKLPVSREEQKQVEQINQEIKILSEQSRILHRVMKKGYMDSAVFMENQNLLAHKLCECKRKRAIILQKQKRRTEIVKTEQTIGILKSEGCILNEFREDLFDLLVKEIKISKDYAIIFILKNGLELAEHTQKEGETTCSGICQSDIR